MAGDKDTLLGMGFEAARVDWALRSTGNAGLQPALDFLFAHSDDPIPDPTAQASTSTASTTSDTQIDEDQMDEEDLDVIKPVIRKLPVGEGSVNPVTGIAEAKSIKCSQCGKLFKEQAIASFHADMSGHDQFEESTEEIKPLTEKEKIQKIAELRAKLAEKRAQKNTQDAEEAQANASIRRKADREASDAREALKAKEAIKMAEQARREKEEDRKARAEIKRRIEQDKEERRERAEREKRLRQGETVEATPAPPPVTSPGTGKTAGSDNKDTRIQIRLASGGKPFQTVMDSESTLSDLAEYLATQAPNIDVNTVSFSSQWPRIQFSREDFSKTLRELQLTPSATLIAS